MEEVKEKEETKEVVLEDEPSEEAALKEAEAQILKEYIEKEYPGFGTVKIYHPTIAIESELDAAFTNEFNKALKEKKDMPTSTQLEEILDERGSWTSEHEDKLDTFRDAIQADYTEIAKLRSKRGKHNKKVTDLNVKKYQDNLLKTSRELSKLIANKSRLFDGTIESMVEKSILKLKLIKCVMNGEGKPKWKDLNALDGEYGTHLLPLIRDCSKFWAGMSDPLFDKSLNQAFGDFDTELQ